MDARTETMIAKLYPPIREAAESFIREAETIGAFLYQGYRSLDEQKALYAQGRITPGQIVTDARPGWSAHNYGLGIDVVFKNGADEWDWANTFDWPQLAVIGKKHGFEAGADWPEFPDRPHFQMLFGHNVQDLYKVYARTWLLADVWVWISNTIKVGYDKS